ncbi:MAG: hypothetical protein QXW75_00565 [Thermoplasmatales archaeon]
MEKKDINSEAGKEYGIGFMGMWQRISNAKEFGSSTCQYNAYPEEPCKEKAVEFPKIAGLITPMCAKHYAIWEKMDDDLVNALRGFHRER